MTVLVGADPEFFVSKEHNLISAHGMIPGTKEQPHPVKDGAVQVDGMALEFNIDPADSADKFKHNINSVLGSLREMVPEEYAFEFIPVARFGDDYIAKQPKEARMLGCEPDLDAWSGHENHPPNVDAPFRTASGHVHVGWTKDADMTSLQHRTECIWMAKQLDLFLAVPSLRFDKDGQARRNLYGKAGCYRIKPYGMEYRTLSNFWLKSDPWKEWVFTQVQRAMDAIKEGKIVAEDSFIGTKVKRAIMAPGAPNQDLPGILRRWRVEEGMPNEI